MQTYNYSSYNNGPSPRMYDPKSNAFCLDLDKERAAYSTSQNEIIYLRYNKGLEALLLET